ncbi:hypothetical protein COOONC_06532, partial [Cooperia oncophora]
LCNWSYNDGDLFIQNAGVSAVPPVPATVQAARSLKRRSIGFQNKTVAKKLALSTTTSRSSVMRPLPDSMRTGRATMAVPGAQPRYLQATAAAANRKSSTGNTRSGTSQIQSSSIIRRSSSSSSVHRENAELAEMRTKIMQLEGELIKIRAESELTKSQLALKDQNLEMVQSSLECFKQTIALKDAQLNTIQMALDAEKGKSTMMQVSIDAVGNTL